MTPIYNKDKILAAIDAGAVNLDTIVEMTNMNRKSAASLLSLMTKRGEITRHRVTETLVVERFEYEALK
jgi:hypothetical protein